MIDDSIVQDEQRPWSIYVVTKNEQIQTQENEAEKDDVVDLQDECDYMMEVQIQENEVNDDVVDL